MEEGNKTDSVQSSTNAIANAVYLLQRAGINAEFSFLTKDFRMLVETISVAENSIAVLRSVVEQVTKNREADNEKTQK